MIFDKILNIYKNYKHNKLTDYLENINSTKHVIYTFSNIFEYIFGMDFEKTIMNKKYNKIFKKENSIEIYVQDCKSEREIEDQISFLSKSYCDYILDSDIFQCLKTSPGRRPFLCPDLV